MNNGDDFGYFSNPDARRNGLLRRVVLPALRFVDPPAPPPVGVPADPAWPEHSEELLNCDLCNLAYHLYHQTLVWPLDPWYEVLAYLGSNRRDNFMAHVHDFAVKRQGEREMDHDYAGPGVFRKLGTHEKKLDPVLTRYRQMNPNLPAFTGDGGVFLGIMTPDYVAGPIGRVSVAMRGPNFYSPPAPVMLREAGPAGGRDELIAFEGGTGLRDEKKGGTAAAWSLMGFVLKRFRGDTAVWDAHIVFRGSRSGSAARAMKNAKKMVVSTAMGNPDWVTDLDDRQEQFLQFGDKIAAGFAHAFLSCAPTLIVALKTLQGPGEPPASVQITGHSLGAALASLCCAALTLPGEPQTNFIAALPTWNLADSEVIRGYFFAEPSICSAEYCKKFEKRLTRQIKGQSAFRAKAPYVIGDLIAESSKSIKYWGTDKGLGAKFAPKDGYTLGELKPMKRPKGSFDSGENSHELYLIRAAIIEKEYAAGWSQTVRSVMARRTETPWAKFANFKDLLDGQPASGLMPKARFVGAINRENLRAVLENYAFAANFGDFLDLLTVVVGDKASYGGKHKEASYEKARFAVRSAAAWLAMLRINGPGGLEEVLENLRTKSEGLVEKNLARHITLGLILAGIQLGYLTVGGCERNPVLAKCLAQAADKHGLGS